MMGPDHTLESALTILGLTAKERRFFLSNFNLGPATIDEVAISARLQRSGAYLIAKNLLQKGFLREDLHSYRKNVYTVPPEDILRRLAGKQRFLRREEVSFTEALPQLHNMYANNDIRPKVQVFEGSFGLRSVWQDVLTLKQEVLLWSNQETESSFFTPEFHAAFISERQKKGITIRVLAVNNEKGQSLQKNDQTSLRQTLLLPNNVDFSAETYIYGHKIAIIDHKKDIIGVIIESEPIAAAQRAIFELNWSQLV